MPKGAPRLRLEEGLRPRFSSTPGRWPETSLQAWTADLRGLEPELLKVATHDESEEESAKANSLSGKEPMGRNHAARWVVALWRETDALARAKGMACLAAHPGWLDEVAGLLGPRWRLEQEFAITVAKLDAARRKALDQFARALPEFRLPRQDVSDKQLTLARDWALEQLKAPADN
jgi:hypothetical protein